MTKWLPHLAFDASLPLISLLSMHFMQCIWSYMKNICIGTTCVGCTEIGAWTLQMP